MTEARAGELGTVRVALGALVVLALSCAVLLTVFAPDYFPLQADETSLAWQSKLARDGYLPYRDYFAFKPPLVIYLPAGAFALFGSSLAVLRLFSIAALAVATVLLFLLCVRARMGVAWAACAALMLPALLVPHWPVPSGQWLALTFGLAALVCVATPRPRIAAVVAAGGLVALAGLCVQTHGALFAGLLAIRLVSDPETRNARTLVEAAAGIVAPLLLTVIALWYAGILPKAFADVVLWPMQYYKQPGGFNDVSQSAAVAPSAAVWTPQLLIAVGGLLIAVSVPFMATASSVLLWRRGARGPRASFALLGAALLWLLFATGRTDQVHLFFLAPVFLYLGVQHVDWHGHGRAVLVVRLWLVLAAVAMLQWPVSWIGQPPSVEAVRAVDAGWRERGVPTLISRLPGVQQNQSPVVFLSHGGSSLYLFWAPLPPPVDWLFPPSSLLNSPEEYRALADFADAHAVPYVVVPIEVEARWLRDASPIRELLTERYRRAFETSWGVAYCRIGVRLPRTGEVVCDLAPPPSGAPGAR